MDDAAPALCASLARAPTPTAAWLASAKLRLEFTARVGQEQLTGLEPVLGASTREQRRDRAREFGILGAAEVPECRRLHRLIEAQDLFDPAVAVGRNDQV